MISKLLALLLSTFILACPFNCMPERGDSTETASQSCCNHCQTDTNSDPLIPQSSSSDCCQCLCTGAILDNSHQIDLELLNLVWSHLSIQEVQFQSASLNTQHSEALSDPDEPSGRQIRCLQMSFQC